MCARDYRVSKYLINLSIVGTIYLVLAEKTPEPSNVNGIKYGPTKVCWRKWH